MCDHPKYLLELIGTREVYTGMEHLPVFKCDCNEILAIVYNGKLELTSIGYGFDPEFYYPIGSDKEVKL